MTERMKPKVAILVTEGTNCHEEMARAFELAGGNVEEVHVSQLVDGDRHLMRDDFRVVGYPGGFTYGDRLGSGYVHGVELQTRLGHQLQRFVDDGRQVFGVCNGFQVLVRSGLLPDGKMGQGPSQDAALTRNKNGRFFNNIVEHLIRADTVASCVSDAMRGQVTPIQVAHGEGRFMVDPDVYSRLRTNGQIALQYCTANGAIPDEANFNGSYANIAGITSPNGNVTGMMGHPERDIDTRGGMPPHGLAFFQAIIDRVNQS